MESVTREIIWFLKVQSHGCGFPVIVNLSSVKTAFLSFSDAPGGEVCYDHVPDRP